MIKKRINYGAILLGGFLLSSVSAAEKVDFEQEIAPILEEGCQFCHGEDAQESGFRLDGLAYLLKGGDSGFAAVVPGKPEQSYLLDAIRHADEAIAMPPYEDKLPQEQIDLIARWIAEGAIWPGQSVTIDSENSDHWSFQPVVRPEVPSSDKTRENPIDRFLAKKLAKEGLSFSPPADPRSLLRRVSIILTGLPPTSEELERFLKAYNQDAGAAYLAAIDRLLASPHFGERWAQHWLDVIRWAETNGSESNMYRKNAWIYRDYVVRAFNEDKPYDQFLFEQIAGDTVGQGDATGYLVAGPHVPVATVGREPSAQRQARADRMDEVLQTIGASALGLTISCARCHNHKFDPISIQDYYSMSAVFQDVEFGSRYPELAEDHPRSVRERELSQEIAGIHQQLKQWGPWQENWTGYRELHFPKTETRKIRISFEWKAVRLDEIEMFGPAEPERNFALASEGTQTVSPPEMTNYRAKLKEVNDGKYGTMAWVAKSLPGSKEKPWIEFSFPEPREIQRIRMSTNREDFLETDYLLGINNFNFGDYRVEVETLQGEWKQIAATKNFNLKNKTHPLRGKLQKELKGLIEEVGEAGVQPSFVGNFIAPVQTYVFGRGSPENPREEVFPKGLSELEGDLQLSSDAPGPQRRVAFAKWLIREEHPLTARVAANRLWHHVFGQGIVTTTSDFGAAGTEPTHPELLDWLAAELVGPTFEASRNEAQPWSMKHLIRLMVMSKAFRQSSSPTQRGLDKDADSALLWRFPPKRVEAEVIRDAILQAAGGLDRSLGGRSFRIHNVKKRYSQWEVVDNHGPETWRRMLYQERMRRVDDQMFTAFDFPDCGQVRAKRPISTTPLQALNLMNSPFVIEQANLIAERAKEFGGDKAQAVDQCFYRLLGRFPTDGERQAALELANEFDLSLVCRALINSNEFAFLP
ncbi:Secreted protein containing planctomycete cytochrome C domain [Planctomycetales bacterium 10988]|nr:Secreted protein containing planctomycete cytochrome C domain [Planctomycetales bacterium 10988]